MEPEIVDLAIFLNRAGAKVYGAGTNTIRIKGVEKLKEVSYKIMPDRIEANIKFSVAPTLGKSNCIFFVTILSHLHII